jgi:hypothetical protein
VDFRRGSARKVHGPQSSASPDDALDKEAFVPSSRPPPMLEITCPSPTTTVRPSPLSRKEPRTGPESSWLILVSSQEW